MYTRTEKKDGDRETGGQKDRQFYSDTDVGIDRTDRRRKRTRKAQNEREKDTETERETERERDRYRDRMREKKTLRQKEKQ